ncbi:CHAT domain-containing protein [Candidatus Oscillochloris fontis]|uniref:CHAT domain-containing protein n=1 Tax=Candidatus Oscillochloris fontis TaxID=2496868 RepID=UPI00101C67A9|nr:CHAT domain-containing protein [Candidatus Oscillochloris fontis]
MDIDHLINLIHHPDLSVDEVAHEIDQHLPPEVITSDLLLKVRGSLYVETDQSKILRGMLLGARLCPQGTASALDIYGMWANRLNVAYIDPNLLRVAAWAYHWAGDIVGCARAKVNLAETLYTRDYFERALQLADESLRVFQMHAHQAGMDKARLIKANTWVELQDMAQAEPIYVQLREEWRAEKGDTERLIRYIELLDVYAYALENLSDQFDVACELYNEVEQLIDHTDAYAACAFRLYLNRSVLEMRLGRHAHARALQEQASLWLVRGLNVNKLSLSDAYDLYQYQFILSLLLDNYSYAEIVIEKLINLSDQGNISPKQQAELHRLHALLLDDFDQALPLMQKARKEFERLGANLLVLTCTTELAERAYIAGRYEIARTCLAEAEALLAGVDLPRRQLELRRIRVQYDPLVPLAERVAISEALLQAGDYLGATAVWSQIGRYHEGAKDTHAAYQAYQAALDAAAHARGMVRMSLHTLRLGHAYRYAAERAFMLAPSAEASWVVSERLRAQTLLDEMSNAGIWRLLDRDDLAEIREAYEQLRYSQARLALSESRVRRPTIASEDAKDQPRLNAERHHAEAHYFATLNRLATTKMTQIGWMTGQPATTDAICAALPARTLLVALTLVGGINDGTLWATLLHDQGVLARLQLADQTEWKAFIKAWPSDFQITDVLTLSTEAQQDVLIELYTMFIEKLEDYLSDANALIFALDDALPLYPLHAAYDDTRYLIERMPVSYIPSGTVLTLLQARQAQRPPRTKRIFLGYDAAGEANYAPLPNLSSELAHLATLVDATAQPGPLTPDALLSHLADAQMLHLSCHGEFPPNTSPRFAQLIIGPQRIYADDLYRADLALELLFLDACHSGRVGPGLQGFVGAALVAGASSVIAAMWEVEYNVARSLVRTFYQHWQTGMPCAAALRQAQLALIAQPPSLWAHFFLTGL